MTFAKPSAGPDRAPVEPLRTQLARLADPPELPLPEAFRRVCEAVAEALRVERAGIWLFVNGDRVLRCVSLFERSKRKHSKGACLSLDHCPNFLEAISSSSVLPCAAARSDPRTVELRDSYLAPLGIASLLDVPLSREGRAIGVVCLEHVGGSREWSDDDRSMALAAADSVLGRMKAAEGALRIAPRPHFVVVPPALPLATRAAHELRNLLAEIRAGADAISRTPGLAAHAAARLTDIVAAAVRGTELVHDLFDAPDATPANELDTLPMTPDRTLRPPDDDDTGEHQPLPAS